MVKGRKDHTTDPQILGAAVQNLVALMTWCPGLVHLWPKKNHIRAPAMVLWFLTSHHHQFLV